LYSGIEYDSHLDIEPNAIRSATFKAKHPPQTDAKKLEAVEALWKFEAGILKKSIIDYFALSKFACFIIFRTTTRNE